MTVARIINCPACKAVLEFEESFSAKEILCHNCSATVQVTGPRAKISRDSGQYKSHKSIRGDLINLNQYSEQESRRKSRSIFLVILFLLSSIGIIVILYLLFPHLIY